MVCPSVQVLVSCLNFLIPLWFGGQASVLSVNEDVQVAGGGAWVPGQPWMFG